LVIDDALIEIKTTKDFKVRREYFDSTHRYYLLFRIGGISGCKGHMIKKLGIYFSRHGHLWLFDVSAVIKEKRLSSFVGWLRNERDRACEVEVWLVLFENSITTLAS